MKENLFWIMIIASAVGSSVVYFCVQYLLPKLEGKTNILYKIGRYIVVSFAIVVVIIALAIGFVYCCLRVTDGIPK